MVGFATTATFRAGAPPKGGDTYMGLGGQVEKIAAMSGPKVVVFQDLDDPPVAATFGEIMCTTYKAFGCVGLITSGAGRDLDQGRTAEVPDASPAAPCRRTGTRKSWNWRFAGSRRRRVGESRRPVARRPQRRDDDPAGTCRAFDRRGLRSGFMDAEAVVLEYLRKGNATAAGFTAARDECKRAA